MTGVALRCPTCGTTQNHPGECEACSDGEVRYFCSNHTPGLWLDEPVCGRCGARFGDPPKLPRATPPATPSAPTRPRPRPISRPATRHGVEPPDTRARRPPTEVPDAEEEMPSLADVLVDMLEEGKRARERVEDVPWRRPIEPAPRPRFPVGGCLIRLLLFVLLLIALAFSGLLFLFGGGF